MHEDRLRAESFGADAEQYDRARPSYPAQLVDDLLESAPATVLDVGCGTGKAGRLFVERGCAVTGVEPDPRMAVVARRHGLDVEEAPFETWEAGGRRFDLLISGQAWHWVDPVAGAAKARDVLRETGRIALFWNIGEHDPETQALLDDVYGRIAPEAHTAGAVPLDRIRDVTGGAHTTLLEATELFSSPEQRAYEWEQRYSTMEWLDHLPTHSNHRVLPVEQLATLLAAVGRVVDERGGALTLHFHTWMVTAQAR